MTMIATAESGGIALNGISLTYNRKRSTVSALQGIELDLAPDDFVCVLGPSGCGKSSLLNIVAGYLEPTEGTVLINGNEHTEPNAQVGVVFQHANLFPWLNIAKNIEFGVKMAKLPRAERKRRVNFYLDLVGLGQAGALLPHQLSGGMKQRAAIARTLATEPRIVLMDEPFSALDALTRESMQMHLRRIWLQTRKCIFFITHDVDEALLLGRRILIMHPNPGRIVQDFVNPVFVPEGEFSFSDARGGQAFAELRALLISQIANGSGNGS
ncbi:ABC transporter ATP-binding protein [Cohnella nanjingensis]|uniref:ABC transporter ATP-binding protein n=1 Tax=Cohnella nanjingensis TaxID=1387779 RepID=A0A7X0RSY9_9BACL|nr:ABC transporter ATP-binding protein [Cohnella nanjingensis]MBB6672951.1 ABC transporter ATP-binding protein [Cohnella nanjingensis]